MSVGVDQAVVWMSFIMIAMLGLQPFGSPLGAGFSLGGEGVEGERMDGPVRTIFLRADQPVKKYILTEFRVSCCVYGQVVPTGGGVCHTPWDGGVSCN